MPWNFLFARLGRLALFKRSLYVAVLSANTVNEISSLKKSPFSKYCQWHFLIEEKPKGLDWVRFLTLDYGSSFHSCHDCTKVKKENFKRHANSASVLLALRLFVLVNSWRFHDYFLRELYPMHRTHPKKTVMKIEKCRKFELNITRSRTKSQNIGYLFSICFKVFG